MAVWSIILIIICGLLILGIICGVCWWISVYNKLIKLRNNAEEGYATMDVCMKKRYDLIPNLVETVKGYAKHEKEALEAVMSARYSCMSANSDEEKAKSENMLTGSLKTLFAVTENYPDLKANANFNQLMNSLQSVEAEIATSRKSYNSLVREYNTTCEIFPANWVAKHYRFEKKVLFEITDAEERKAPKVQF